MSDINQCTFTGRLGADPEFKSFQNGGRMCNMRMAVGEQWKDRDGNKKERTEWVSVAITNEGLVGVAERFLRKGSRIAITGQFRTRKWQDQNGNDRYSTEIVLPPFHGTLVMLDSAGDKSRGTQSRTREPDGSRGAPADSGWGDDDLNDDIPFITSAGIW